MVVLDREMQKPEAVRVAASGPQERQTDAGKNVLTAKRGEAGAEGDMHRLRRAVTRARQVRRVPALGALAAGAPSGAAPRERKREGELVLARALLASTVAPLLCCPQSCRRCHPLSQLEFGYSARAVVVKRYALWFA